MNSISGGDAVGKEIRFMYAAVEGEKKLPFKRGKGICGCCGGGLIAKCGEINVHHWAHEKGDDCDSWSEPMGAWHRWWQDLVHIEAVEVPIGPHRADIVGNGGVIVELQHSPIPSEHIAAREAHYGKMVWLFDATWRFGELHSGNRVFFTLARTKHLELCKKPVCLDFGTHIVQVECFSSAITGVSGFGTLRSRQWFADTYLSTALKPAACPSNTVTVTPLERDPWGVKSPIKKLKYPTKWYDPQRGEEVLYPKWSSYIDVRTGYYLKADRLTVVWDYEKIIDQHPTIANGWTKEALLEMKALLGGYTVILDGVLRLIPSSPEQMKVTIDVETTEQLLVKAEAHIEAGRLPILKPATKQSLLEKARANEPWFLRTPQPERPRSQEPSRDLFDQGDIGE